MDRPLLLHPLILLLPITATGQPIGRSALGVKAGAQWCTLMASDPFSKDIPGGLAGVYFPLLAGHRFEIQPEMLLSYQGCDRIRTETETIRYRMLYLYVPVSAKVFLTNELDLQGGLQMGRCLNARSEDTDITSNMRPYEAGFIAGIGLDTRGGWDFGARYFGGMTPILRETTGVNPRNRTIQVSAGYRVMRLNHRRHRLRKG